MNPKYKGSTWLQLKAMVSELIFDVSTVLDSHLVNNYVVELVTCPFFF